MKVPGLALATVPLLFPLATFAYQYTKSPEVFSTGVQRQLVVSLVLSIGTFFLTRALIPDVARLTGRKLSGKDLNKPGAKEEKPDVPESLGVVPGTVYLLALIVWQLASGVQLDASTLVVHNAALHCVTFMLFLGFADDVMDLRWRYKLILPSIATLPLLLAYSGSTSVVVPLPLRAALGGLESVELGPLYYLYMGLLAVFCTNAINIYAGINGLEAGQSFVIGCAVLVHNLVELSGTSAPHHLFSFVLVLPFVAGTGGLLCHNWFPSRVFVGDTFTYFAGVTLAVAGILGHFSKTLLLFFIPQILNFLYSVPQLIGIIPCPRHRLPQLDPKTNRLVGIRTNLNLVNGVLCLTGPMHERSLCILLLGFQVFCCAFGFWVRYELSRYFY